MKLIRQRFKWLFPIFLSLGLLMGFSNVQDDPSDQLEKIENIEELNPIDVSIEDLQELIETFTDRGEIADENISRALLTHLTALDHYTNQGQWQKAVTHMDGFKDMIHQFRQMDQISS